MPVTINSVSDGNFNWEPELFDQNNKYQWCTRGENCSFCNSMNGRVYFLDVYITATVYPGSIHPNCDCYLKQVPGWIPESDRDIFGSMLSWRDDGWLEFLFNNPSNTWLPFNTSITLALMKYSQPGMTAYQALQAYLNAQKIDSFINYRSGTSIFWAPWDVFKSANPDLYQTFGSILKDIVVGLYNLESGDENLKYIYHSLKNFQSGAILTSAKGLFPNAATLNAVFPSTSYNNTASSFLLKKSAEAVGVASVVKKVKPYPIRGWGR